jgi:hypothetical protein
LASGTGRNSAVIGKGGKRKNPRQAGGPSKFQQRGGDKEPSRLRSWGWKALKAFGLPFAVLAIIFFLKGNLLLNGVGAVLATGDPDLPPLIEDAQAAELLQAARATLTFQPAAKTAMPLSIIGAAVEVYNENGPWYGGACLGDDAIAAVTCAAKRVAQKIPTFGESESHNLSIHLLRERRSATPYWLRDAGFGHSRGLYSVLLTDAQGSHLATDTHMHVRGLTVETAVDYLAANRTGILVAKAEAPAGAFVVPTESFTEYQGKPVRLYRASTHLPEVTGEQIRQFCRLGGDYLVGILQPNHKWLYEGNLGYDRYNKSYNLLRHAGTIYSLYQLFLTTKDDRYRYAGDGGWIWLMQQVKRERDDKGKLCAFVVERKRKGKKTAYTVKLGGTGLTLIALAEKMQFDKSEANLKLGRELANHILRSQRSDGSFKSYWPYKTKKAKLRRSIYYPGEAMLGLVRFYEHDPDPRYLEALNLSANYFINERWNVLGMRFNVPPDAWLMLALAELYKVSPNDDYAGHCATLVDSMMNDQLNRGWETPYRDYAGGYFPYPPVVTPAGSRMEGMTACYYAMKKSGRDVAPLRATLKQAARFQTERIIRPEFAHLYPNPRRGLGAFRHSPVHNAIRIDYNQHNISGLLIAADILEE